MQNRSLRRFLTLFAACVVSLCAAAYLSFEAASQQEGAAGQIALATGDSDTPKSEAGVDPAPVATIGPPSASQVAANKAAAVDSAAEDATLLRVSLHPNSDPDVPLALASGTAADPRLDLRSSAPVNVPSSEPSSEATLPEAAKPAAAAQPEKAAPPEKAVQIEVAPQQMVIAPLPPLPPASFGPGKPVPLPPVRPASLTAAVTPPAQVTSRRKPTLPRSSRPPSTPPSPSATPVVAPSAASQVPVPAPARVEARLEAPMRCPRSATRWRR